MVLGGVVVIAAGRLLGLGLVLLVVGVLALGGWFWAGEIVVRPGGVGVIGVLVLGARVRVAFILVVIGILVIIILSASVVIILTARVVIILVTLTVTVAVIVICLGIAALVVIALSVGGVLVVRVLLVGVLGTLVVRDLLGLGLAV